MKKMKKINGYLVVKFNDREKRLNADIGLGCFGVIDAEQYTGILDIDRDAMEYDSADTIEEAIEQARGLESELDTEEPPVKFTIVTETDTGSTEEDVDPVSLFRRESNLIHNQAENPDWHYIDKYTAPYHLRGYVSALEDIGLIDTGDERFRVDMEELDDRIPALLTPQQFDALRKILTAPPDTESCPPAAPQVQTFLHPPERHYLEPEQLFRLGVMLLENCPDDDCIIYRNTFQMCRELDEQLDRLAGQPRRELKSRLKRQYRELEHMYRTNYAVKRYRQEPPLTSAYHNPEGVSSYDEK